MAYKDLLDEEAIADYKRKKALEKEAKEKEASELTAKELKAKRAEIEASLKARFLASAGLESDWLRIKQRVLDDYFVAKTLEPDEPEAEKPEVTLPMSRRRYLDR